MPPCRLEKFFRRGCRLDDNDNLDIFFLLGRIHLGAGSAGLLCRAAGASQPLAKKSVLQSSHGRTGIFVTLVPPMSRKRGWASPYSLGEPSNEVGASHQTRLGRAIKRGWGEPSNEVGASHQTRLGRAIKRGWASHQTRLGEPVLRGRWASPYSLGEPVGRASTRGPLGEPVLRGRWASPYSLGEPVLIGRANFYSGLHSGQRLRLLGAPTVPARHQVPARHV